MYACGLRVSEATTLEVGAICQVDMVLRIIGKGNKERLVPLPQPILDELGRLWQTHHNRRWLFPNRQGTAPVSRAVLAATFAAAASGCGIPKDFTPHTLRHYVSFPTMSGNAGSSAILPVNHSLKRADG